MTPSLCPRCRATDITVFDRVKLRAPLGPLALSTLLVVACEGEGPWLSTAQSYTHTLFRCCRNNAERQTWLLTACELEKVP